MVGDFNIDIEVAKKPHVHKYLTLLAGYELSNVIDDYTREEWRGEIFTQTCIDHIAIPTSIQSLSGVIQKKLRTTISLL